MDCQHILHKTSVPILLLMLLLPACTSVGPSYQPPNIAMPPQWNHTAQNISVTTDTKINSWWTLFNDPVLDSLVARATVSNQDLRIAETRILEARAARQATAANSLPGIDASASYNQSHAGENTSSGKTDRNLFQASFDMGWELDLFGGNRRATEAADAAIAVSEEDKRDVLISLIAEVSRNYIELRGLQQRLAIAEETIANQEKTVAMVNKKLQLGFGSELAVVQAQTQLAMTRAQVPGLAGAASHSMHRLALLLGQTPDTLVAELTPKENIPTISPQVPTTLPSELLRQRPDIRRAERQLAVATAEIGVATAELFPRFSLTSFIGFERTNLSNLVTSGSRFWSAGPKVRWSLFDGGKARAGINASNAQRDRAEIVYEKTVLTALVEVENALVALSREQETLRILQTAVTAAERALTISKSQYSLGLVDFLNVLLSERSFYQSHDELVLSEQRLSLHITSLFKALGGGWENQTKDNEPKLSLFGTPDFKSNFVNNRQRARTTIPL